MGYLTESVAFDILGFVVAVLIMAITYFKWKLSYWGKIGLPTLDPTIPFGDSKKLMLGRSSFGEQFQEYYNKFKALGLRHGGIYLGLKPWYIPTDPAIVKHIMQNGFSHFMNHGTYVDEENDPLSGHLFSLADTKWKNLRLKLTPAFTGSKMKMMFQTLADTTPGLKNIMDESAKSHMPVDIKDVLSRFTTDTIASVAFGLDCNSLKDSESLFIKYGKKVFEPDRWHTIKSIIQFACPTRVLKFFKFKVTKPDVENFFMTTVQDTVRYREENNIYRKDFMHLLLQLKNRGVVADDEHITDKQGQCSEKALTVNELAAQVFVFFLAGFETSSTTMTWALYELATNPRVQDKLREEIITVLSKHDDKLTYDGIMEMTYMDKVLHETLRKHPSVPILQRICNKDYTIPDSDTVVEKGVFVGISTLGLHNDPEYYPNPTVFDPERFSDENKNSRPAFTYLPFGEGPRICIGFRFGLMQSKVGLATLLKNYRIKMSSKTKLPLKLDTNSFITSAEGGIWLDVEKCN